MPTTLKDMARHLRNVITSELPENYEIDSMYKMIANQRDIQAGVLAFRNFLYRFCDVLIDEGDLYDTHKKIAHAFDDRITISVYYPFLHNVKCLLLNMGYYGLLTENAESLVVENNIFNLKIPVSKSMECLRFLSNCGILFKGIDLSERKPDLSKVGKIEIFYPDNPAMLTGLKVMAVAEIEVGKYAKKFKATCYSRYADILLRCDYRVLKSDETDVISILQDTIKPLPANVQDLILQLHQRYMDKGLKCDADIKDLWVKIRYSYKRNEIWGINASLSNGYQINIKAKNTSKYTEATEKFPSFLQEMIHKGFGCGKKRGITNCCDGGCRGYRISLDESIINIRNAIETWLDMEISNA